MIDLRLFYEIENFIDLITIGPTHAEVMGRLSNVKTNSKHITAIINAIRKTTGVTTVEMAPIFGFYDASGISGRIREHNIKVNPYHEDFDGEYLHIFSQVKLNADKTDSWMKSYNGKKTAYYGPNANKTDIFSLMTKDRQESAIAAIRPNTRDRIMYLHSIGKNSVEIASKTHLQAPMINEIIKRG